MKNNAKYLKLVAVNMGDFESKITFEKNYPSTDEGRVSLNGDMRKCEDKGLVCAFAEMNTPVLTQ